LVASRSSSRRRSRGRTAAPPRPGTRRLRPDRRIGIVERLSDDLIEGRLHLLAQLLGGDNKLAFQYGKGGGTGFGTLGRFYYPDFSLKHDPATESRTRVVDVLTVQPVDWLGGQADFVYQHDAAESGSSNWTSAGARVAFAFTEHAKLLGEVGYDHVISVEHEDEEIRAIDLAAACVDSRALDDVRGEVDGRWFDRSTLGRLFAWRLGRDPA